MKILIISTGVYSLPPKGYSGLEVLVYNLAEGLASKDHQVSVVCPAGSSFTLDNIEPIFTATNETEDVSWQRYKGRMEAGEWNVILDSSWQRWATMSIVGKDSKLQIVNWHHTDPSVYQTLQPVPYPCWVGISKNHAERLSRHFKIPVKFVYNGIDTNFYKSNGKPKDGHYLWMARWTPEKAAMETIEIAQRARVPIHMYGDTSLVGDQSYVRKCFDRADGYFARANPGISREDTVNEYSKADGLIQLYNWDEPFGLNLVEALACGCPPIAQRKGAAPELIKHGETGFIVDCIEDVLILIKEGSVKKIDPVVMRKHVEENFSLEKFVNNWESLLTEVANGLRW